MRNLSLRAAAAFRPPDPKQPRKTSRTDPHLIVYMTDFGGPVGMRMAVHHPDWISGLIFLRILSS
jgi:pimeloyl-ACP methyl ester carboxylesterase